MAAGLVTVNFKDGGGSTLTGRFWSSDGTTAGLLYSAPVLIDGSGNVVDFTATSPVSLAAGSNIAGKFGIDQTTRGTTNAVVPLSAQTLATAQVSVTTSATQIAASRAGRRSITIINEGTTVVRLGVSGVTTGTGAYLAGVAGASVTLETEAAVYGIVGSGTQTVSCIENY